MTKKKLSGEIVSYQGNEYKCHGDLTDDAQLTVWDANTTYKKGDRVALVVYEATDKTQGQCPITYLGIGQPWGMALPPSPSPSPKPPSPSPKPTTALMTGYLTNWGTHVTFTEAAKQGYTAIVLAFGSINADEIDIYPGNFFAANEALKSDIANAKSEGAKQILLSVGGGENNTYKPGAAKPKSVATNIVKFLKEYGFTGIDFDLEITGDAQYLDDLCAEIKAQDPSLVITAAPQVNQMSQDPVDTPLILVSTGYSNIYETAVTNNRFDYLFIQAYNNGWPKLNGLSEFDTGFISNAFRSLTATIPDSTLIAIGEPASISSAPSANVYKGPDAGSDIYTKMAEQYKSINKDSGFGGAMCWSINQDADTGYQFVTAMKNSV